MLHGERPLAVATAVNEYLKPFVMGKNVEDIEDIWQSAYVSSYFRSGVTLNNALAGVDGALWDICGKRANMPVYKMLGGKLRAAVPLYGHASAVELPALEDQMVLFTPFGIEGDGAADRVDALVWALSDLFPRMVRPQPSVTWDDDSGGGIGSWLL